MPKRIQLKAEAAGLRKLLKQRFLSAQPLTAAAAILLKMHVRRLAKVEQELAIVEKRPKRGAPTREG